MYWCRCVSWISFVSWQRRYRRSPAFVSLKSLADLSELRGRHRQRPAGRERRTVGPVIMSDRGVRNGEDLNDETEQGARIKSEVSFAPLVSRAHDGDSWQHHRSASMNLSSTSESEFENQIQDSGNNSSIYCDSTSTLRSLDSAIESPGKECKYHGPPVPISTSTPIPSAESNYEDSMIATYMEYSPLSSFTQSMISNSKTLDANRWESVDDGIETHNSSSGTLHQQILDQSSDSSILAAAVAKAELLDQSNYLPLFSGHTASSSSPYAQAPSATAVGGDPSGQDVTMYSNWMPHHEQSEDSPAHSLSEQHHLMLDQHKQQQQQQQPTSSSSHGKYFHIEY